MRPVRPIRKNCAAVRSTSTFVETVLRMIADSWFGSARYRFQRSSRKPPIHGARPSHSGAGAPVESTFTR